MNSNAVEVLLSVFALREGAVELIRSSLAGGIISNLLFVSGCSIIAYWLSTKAWAWKILRMGEGRNPYRDPRKARISRTNIWLIAFGLAQCLVFPIAGFIALPRNLNLGSRQHLDLILNCVVTGLYVLFLSLQCIWRKRADKETDETNYINHAVPKPEEDQGTWGPYVLWLIILVIVVAACSECLISYLYILPDAIPAEFKNFIIQPIAGNLAEHMVSIVLAWKGNVSMALSMAVFSAVQINGFCMTAISLLSRLSFSKAEVYNYELTKIESISIVACSCLLVGSLLYTRRHSRYPVDVDGEDVIDANRTKIPDTHVWANWEGFAMLGAFMYVSLPLLPTAAESLTLKSVSLPSYHGFCIESKSTAVRCGKILHAKRASRQCWSLYAW